MLADLPTTLITSTVMCSQLKESGQWRVHSTSTPMITALITSITTMKTLKPRVFTIQLATMLGGLKREFIILTRFLRLSAAVIRFRDCARRHPQTSYMFAQHTINISTKFNWNFHLDKKAMSKEAVFLVWEISHHTEKTKAGLSPQGPLYPRNNTKIIIDYTDMYSPGSNP